MRTPASYFQRPTLWQFIFAVALIVMVLPVVGLYLLGIYQSALVRQTERQLIATGDVIAAQYRATLMQDGEVSATLSHPVDPAFAPEYVEGQLYVNRLARLDLATDPILPREPTPEPSDQVSPPEVQAAAQILQPVVVDTRLYTLASVRVLDHQGLIVASSNPAYIGQSFAQVDEVRRALRGEAVAVLRSKDNRPAPSPVWRWFQTHPVRVNVAIPITAGEQVLGVVYLGRTPNSINAVLRNKWPALTAGIGLILLIVVLLTIGASYWLVRPIRQLVRQARDVAAGARGAVTLIQQPGTREVAELSAALSVMAKKLEERATYIEGFAAQVTHEFKTPLTAIQGAVELMREHGDDMSVEDRERFLRNLAGDSHRLELLVTRLLELARADTKGRESHETADLRPVLATLTQRALDKDRPLEVIMDPKAADPLEVALAEDILATVLINLIDNAHQHAGADAKVLIDVRAQPGAVRVLVADTGPGISASNSGQIFDPFFTTARAKGGTGLGLALVRSHLQGCGGSIALTTPPDGYNTAFSLSIPYGKQA